MGRTGTWFGYQHYGVQPDIVTMAKGMASSYAPISATAARGEIFAKFLNDPGAGNDYFRDISTYGGGTAGFAAALENLRIMEDERLVENGQVLELDEISLHGSHAGYPVFQPGEDFLQVGRGVGGFLIGAERRSCREPGEAQAEGQ